MNKEKYIQLIKTKYDNWFFKKVEKNNGISDMYQIQMFRDQKIYRGQNLIDIEIQAFCYLQAEISFRTNVGEDYFTDIYDQKIIHEIADITDFESLSDKEWCEIFDEMDNNARTNDSLWFIKKTKPKIIIGINYKTY